jgi:hypothetical protein
VRHVQSLTDVPRYPFPVQQLADTMSSDADSQYMLVLALSLAGRAGVEVVDAGRLQTWLAGQVAADNEAVSKAAQLMRVWHECSTCRSPASVLAAAAAQCMLARARCIRVGSADGMVNVYSECSQATITPGVWRAVSSTDVADQERWHRLLDFCAHIALRCMINEVTKAWDRGLQRLDVIRPGLDEYVRRYMHRWDAANMTEGQLSQLRPSMAAAIQGTSQPLHDLSQWPLH